MSSIVNQAGGKVMRNGNIHNDKKILTINIY
jgi:hypothetical protein